MNKKSLLISVCVIIYTLSLQSQNRGVSISDKPDQTPHPSAILELISDDKGFLLPRMETDDRNSISSPSESLMIFNTETQCIEIYVDAEWHDFWCFEGEEPIEPLGCQGYEDGNGGFEIEYQGHTYELVEIGEQCWFAENLRVDELSDGTPIPFIGAEGEDPNWDEWGDTDYGDPYDPDGYPAYTIYYNGSEYDDSYGYLYNQYTARDDFQVCPVGWSIPHDDDWKILAGYVDSDYDAESGEWDGIGYVGSDAALKLKSTTWDGTDEFGFNAKPGGRRTSHGTWDGSQWIEPYYYYEKFGERAYFWVSYGSVSALLWRMNDGSDPIWRDGMNPKNGFSLRCLRDE